MSLEVPGLNEWELDDFEQKRMENIRLLKEQVKKDAERLWIDADVLYAIRQDL